MLSRDLTLFFYLGDFSKDYTFRELLDPVLAGSVYAYLIITYAAQATLEISKHGCFLIRSFQVSSTFRVAMRIYISFPQQVKACCELSV